MNVFVRILCYIFILVLRAVRFISGYVFNFLHRKDETPPLPPITDDILLDSATGIAAKIRAKLVTSEEVVSAFINRIKEVNPIINCVVQDRFALALEEARKVDDIIRDEENKDPAVLEKEVPFLGVPYTIKELFSANGMRWTSGMVSRKDIIANSDADVVIAMKRSGAILLGVTNIPEHGMWWETSNHVYGTSKNPYDIRRTVGGSSGGEGGILAVGGSPCGIGSDVAGSLRIPAFFCGICSHKPTPGVVSNIGQYPMMDPKYLVTGPMSRFCCDLLPMYRVLAAKNVSKLQLDTKVDLSKLRYFYIEDYGQTPLLSPVHPELKSVISKKVVDHFLHKYEIPVQKVMFKELAKSVEMWYCSVNSKGDESSSKTGSFKDEPISLLEPFKALFRRSDHTLAAIMNGLIDRYLVPKPNDPASIEMLALSDHLLRQFEELLGDDAVLLAPTTATPAPYHHQPLTKPLDFGYTAAFNVLGFPVTQVPLGVGSWGVPIGVQVVANAYQDHLTLAVAAELEKAFGGWISP